MGDGNLADYINEGTGEVDEDTALLENSSGLDADERSSQTLSKFLSDVEVQETNDAEVLSDGNLADYINEGTGEVDEDTALLENSSGLDTDERSRLFNAMLQYVAPNLNNQVRLAAVRCHEKNVPMNPRILCEIINEIAPNHELQDAENVEKAKQQVLTEDLKNPILETFANVDNAEVAEAFKTTNEVQIAIDDEDDCRRKNTKRAYKRKNKTCKKAKKDNETLLVNTEACLLIADTNEYVDYISLLQQLVKPDTFYRHWPIVLGIPYTIIRELDSLKLRKDVKVQAQRAIQFLNKQSNKSCVLKEKLNMLEFMELKKTSKLTNDELIVKWCCEQRKKYGEKVFLLTQDKNLRNVASHAGLNVLSAKELLKHLEMSLQDFQLPIISSHADKTKSLQKELKHQIPQQLKDLGKIWRQISTECRQELRKNPRILVNLLDECLTMKEDESLLMNEEDRACIAHLMSVGASLSEATEFYVDCEKDLVKAEVLYLASKLTLS